MQPFDVQKLTSAINSLTSNIFELRTDLQKTNALLDEVRKELKKLTETKPA